VCCSSCLLDELAEERLLSDPYAGIFFSKDRTEQVVEDVENPEWVDAPVPTGTAGDAEIFARSRVLSLSDWMKGCPEGSK